VTIERQAFEIILPFLEAQAGVFDSIKKVKDAAKRIQYIRTTMVY
jgi:hypothetical protein